MRGLGLDLVAVDRIARARRRWGERFLRRVFTDGERRHCAGRGDEDAALAARFAAKEAGMKALGTGWGEGVGWQDVEVRAARGRPPELVLRAGAAERARRLGVGHAWVTLTHDGGVAAAVVVLEAGEEGRR